MLSEKRSSKDRQKRRALSVRNRLRRDDMSPRLSVFRSSKHIYAQVIDDEKGVTLASSSTASKSLTSELGGKNKTQCAALVGSEVARMAKEKGVERVVFDRGSNKYHGRVKALADAAREGGLVF